MLVCISCFSSLQRISRHCGYKPVKKYFTSTSFFLFCALWPNLRWFRKSRSLKSVVPNQALNSVSCFVSWISPAGSLIPACEPKPPSNQPNSTKKYTGIFNKFQCNKLFVSTKDVFLVTDFFCNWIKFLFTAFVASYLSFAGGPVSIFFPRRNIQPDSSYLLDSFQSSFPVFLANCSFQINKSNLFDLLNETFTSELSSVSDPVPSSSGVDYFFATANFSFGGPILYN